MAIGLEAGTVSLWCAEAGGESVQLGIVSNGSDWVTTSLSFSPDSRFLVCIGLPKQETSQASGEVPVPEILIYDLKLLARRHAQEIEVSIRSARRPASAPVSSEHIKVQNLVLAYVSERSHAWLEDIVAHLQHAMGVSDMTRFFEALSVPGNIHDLAVECCGRTIAFLMKSKRASSGSEAPGEKEADALFRREQAVIAWHSEPSPLHKAQVRGGGARGPNSAGVKPDTQTRPNTQTHMLDTLAVRELERNMCMVMQWLLASSKLFQIVWNSYLFNPHNEPINDQASESIAVGSNGRLAAKVNDTQGTPSLMWLNPGLSTASDAECEFLIEKWTALSSDDGLRIGILHRSVTTAGQHHTAKVQYQTWMYGCGNGTRFHTQNGRTVGDKYVEYNCQEGDKFAVVFNRLRGSVSIKINGQSQGVMFDDIAAKDNLFVAIELMCKGERVRISEAFVSSGWWSQPCRVELDALQFRIT